MSNASIITLEEHPYGIALMRDDEIMLTPKRNEVVLPNQALAQLAQEEFSAAPAGNIKKLIYTALDQVEEVREIIIESMLAYLHTDTICYLSDNPELQQFERKYWQPVIDWTEEYFTCTIETFEGIMPGDQPEETAENLGNHLQSYNNWQLTALMDLSSGLSSLLLALAVMQGRLDIEQAFECAYADEIYQNETWGADEEATAKRAKAKAELLDTERFLASVL